jgi:GT2 family glycosyltransferase
MTRVSVIICAYASDRWESLREAVEGVQRQTLAAAEVIVVVDHNMALFERVCTELRGVRGVPNASRRGLSGARNSGVALAASPIVAFLDDDAVPEPDWLARLVAPYAQAAVMATGGRCEPAWAAGRPRWFPAEFDWVVGCTYRGMPDTPSDVRNPIGASMSFRCSALAATGVFREDIGRVGRTPLGCEETELAIRLRDRMPAARIVYVPGAAVAHFVPAARASMSYFLRRCYGEGVSKALVVGAAGAGQALASERRYVRSTLPSGAVGGLRDALRGDAGGLLRAASIVVGLTACVAGYVHGTLHGSRSLRVG